jgi:gamma-glutamyltranspeptidase
MSNLAYPVILIAFVFSGGFMLVQSPEGKMKVIDFREVAPSQATEKMFGKVKKASITVRL